MKLPVNLKHEVVPGIIQVNLDEKRWYAVEQEDGSKNYYPSVTSILDVYPKGFGFKQYLANLNSAEEGKQILEAAGERGSKVHWGIEQLLGNVPLSFHDVPYGYTDQFTASEWQYILTFVNWYEIFRPIVISIEQTVINDDFGFAGTVDLVCQIDEGLLQTYNPRSKKAPVPSGKFVNVLIDWKTSADIYTTAKLQTAAYAETYPASIDYFGVVQLGAKSKAGFKFWYANRFDNERPDYFKIFLNTLEIWKFENENTHPRFQDCPEVITLTEEIDDGLEEGYDSPNISRQAG